MPAQTFTEKLQTAPEASFHVLDPIKAKQMNAKTLYIPSPADVASVITAIPRGETRTIVELRRQLAAIGHAETACPARTVKYWKWLAHASQEGTGYNLPWWRVLKDGKPSRHMPGGFERHIALLREEGVRLQH
jgi:alkylated DNA nucleotide flippase Atl1